MKYAQTLSDQLVPDAPIEPGAITVRSGGAAMVNAEITRSRNAICC